MLMRVFRTAAACLRRGSGKGRGTGARFRWAAIAAGFLALGPAAAQESISYTYDARGRLVKVDHGTTGPNANVSSTYSYDPADNRTNVTIATAAGGGGGTCSGVSFTIASNGAVTEGTNSVFTVTKTGSASGSCAVSYATANGTAMAGSDYTSKSNPLTFTSTQTSKTVTITTTNDLAAESAETFTMSLSAPGSGGSLGTPASATAIINDDDSGGGVCSGVNFTIASNAAVTEGTSSVFTITKTGSTSSSCTVNYASANGTAVAPGDYTAASGPLTFTSAQASKTVAVTTIDDAAVESAETFTMSLSAPGSGATLGTPASATATINDNDSVAPPSFSINDVTGGEGYPITFTVTKTGSTSSSFSVSYATANGTALVTSDYTAATGTLTFAPTDTSKTISVSTVNNGQPEDDETFYVNLSNPTGGATLGDGQGVGTIIDDDDGSICPLGATGQGSADTSTTQSTDSTGISSPNGSVQPMQPVCP